MLDAVSSSCLPVCLPAFQPSFLPSFLPAFQPSFLPSWASFLPSFLPSFHQKTGKKSQKKREKNPQKNNHPLYNHIHYIYDRYSWSKFRTLYIWAYNGHIKKKKNCGFCAVARGGNPPSTRFTRFHVLQYTNYVYSIHRPRAMTAIVTIFGSWLFQRQNMATQL